MEIDYLFVLVIPALFLVLALEHDLNTKKIPNWIPLVILITTTAIQIAVHNPIEALSGFILLFSLSLILYKKNCYYGGDHKAISSLGPAIFFAPNTIPNFLNFAEFAGIFLILGIAYYTYYRKKREIAFMPVIFFSYLAFAIFNIIKHFN